MDIFGGSTKLWGVSCVSSTQLPDRECLARTATKFEHCFPHASLPTCKDDLDMDDKDFAKAGSLKFAWKARIGAVERVGERFGK